MPDLARRMHAARYRENLLRIQEFAEAHHTPFTYLMTEMLEPEMAKRGIKRPNAAFWRKEESRMRRDPQYEAVE